MREVVCYYCSVCGEVSLNRVMIEACEFKHEREQRYKNMLLCTEFEVTKLHLDIIQALNANSKLREKLLSDLFSGNSKQREKLLPDLFSGNANGEKRVGLEVADVIANAASINRNDGFKLDCMKIEVYTAMQICINVLNFETGKYIRDSVNAEWRRKVEAEI